MSLQKVINRKDQKALAGAALQARKREIVEAFRDFVLSQAGELKNIFPYIAIGNGIGGDIVGVSYSSFCTTFNSYPIAHSSHNIVLDSINPAFHVGYAANSASGFKIPFDYNMTKPQMKKLFKQVLEKLVSESYYKHSDYYKKENKNCVVWKGSLIEV